MTEFNEMVTDVTKTIITMEVNALERWNNGDPSGFIEISDEDVVYFDPMSEKRIDGLENLTELYENIRGKVFVEKYKMINPKVQWLDRMAVLTYNLESCIEEKVVRWNCTEVYQLQDDNNWKIIQTHWSLTKAVEAL
ncbi:YybH family protein [Tenuifilum osseticum]|uniref:YybH family protein n=1 Tax=Tenuifilum osseticum TaxID=3374723 RepID=UPI0034E42BA8